jgi:DNA-binding MarR family transcriptional regulator
MQPDIQHAVELRMMIFIMTKIMARRGEQRLAELGIELSWMQTGILRALWRNPTTLSDLSRHFMIDPSTLVPVIDAIERKGYVERQRDPSDRRRTPLTLTPSGERLLEQIGWLGEHEPFADAVKAMGNDKTKQLISLLRELFHHLPESEEQLHIMEDRLRAFGAPHCKPGEET